LPGGTTAHNLRGTMLTLALLLITSDSGEGMNCARPAAPNAASARRLALIMIRNRNRTGRPLPPYDLRIEPDPEDAGQWLAWQTPRGASASQPGGGGMSFRINRCTGQITRITYQR
jgi:hypothetical protein